MLTVGPSADAEFDRARAETTRTRARLYVVLLSLLWIPLILVADPENFGSVRGGLWARIPTIAVLIGTAIYLRRPRPRRDVEIAALAGFGFLFLVWGRVVVVCAPSSVTANMLSIVAGSMAVAGGLLLTWQGTAVLCLLANGAMLTAGLLRVPRPETGYFLLLGSALIVCPTLVLAAASRDRWQRSELEARRKLREANEQLRREQQARSRLFVNLSHDFRTPLSVIRSTVELLRERPLRHDPQLGPALARIDTNAASIVDLIEQLLELARLDASRTPVSARSCDALTIAREVAGQLQPARADVRISVRDRAGDGAPAPTVHVDPSHLRRILQNLVSNSLRQIAGRGGQVRVEVGGRDAERRVAIDVVDDGPGIPADNRDKLFDRFASFRAEGGTVSGIGLALGRELAELNGGSLDLIPDAPETTFRLRLQASDAPRPVLAAEDRSREAAEPPAPPPDAAAFSAALDSHKPSLLVVEDNDDLRGSLRLLLASSFDLEAVGSVAAARASLACRVPKAILCDIMLPDGDGYELLAAVRGNRRFDGVPVIFLSALGEPAERARGLAAGADDYLAKPFFSEELRARIGAAIDRAEERSTAIQRQREDLLMELHDGVCGTLTRAVLALDRLTASPGEEATLAAATAGVREALAEARGLLSVVGSASEAWDNVVAQLRWEASAACERAGAALDFHSVGNVPPLPPAAAHALRRVANEAVTNAIRHGCPRHVRVDLAASCSEVRIRVEDDGRGSSGVPQAGHGLTSVRRRAQRLGGDATFAANPAGGFVLEARLRPEPSGVIVAAVPRARLPIE